MEGLEQSCCCCCWGMGRALSTSLGLGSPDFILEATRRSGIFSPTFPPDSGPDGLPASPPPGPSPGLGAAHQQEVLQKELLLCQCRRCRSLQFLKLLLVKLQVQLESPGGEAPGLLLLSRGGAESKLRKEGKGSSWKWSTSSLPRPPTKPSCLFRVTARGRASREEQWRKRW